MYILILCITSNVIIILIVSIFCFYRYIYIPIQKANVYCGRLIASFLCFTFVFLWHGLELNIFTWTLFNFIGLTIESIGKTIGRSKQFREIQNMYLSPRNSKRLHCMLSSPLLAMSAISNFYFFGGQIIGDIFIQNILYGKFFIVVCFLFFFIFSFLFSFIHSLSFSSFNYKIQMLQYGIGKLKCQVLFFQVPGRFC